MFDIVAEAEMVIEAEMEKIANEFDGTVELDTNDPWYWANYYQVPKPGRGFRFLWGYRP